MNKERTDYPHTIECTPDYGLANITIPRGMTLKAEASAMAYMDPGLQMRTKLGGGFKRMLSGESLFINEFEAPDANGYIGLDRKSVV